MKLPIRISYDRAGKSYDLLDADGKLLGLVFLEVDAVVVRDAVNGKQTEQENGLHQAN